jgi:hypothetical protein
VDTFYAHLTYKAMFDQLEDGSAQGVCACTTWIELCEGSIYSIMYVQRNRGCVVLEQGVHLHSDEEHNH